MTRQEAIKSLTEHNHLTGEIIAALRAPLTTEDALTIPEVQALVAHEEYYDSTTTHCMIEGVKVPCATCAVLAPFRKAKKEIVEHTMPGTIITGPLLMQCPECKGRKLIRASGDTLCPCTDGPYPGWVEVREEAKLCLEYGIHMFMQCPGCNGHPGPMVTDGHCVRCQDSPIPGWVEVREEAKSCLEEASHGVIVDAAAMLAEKEAVSVSRPLISTVLCPHCGQQVDIDDPHRTCSGYNQGALAEIARLKAQVEALHNMPLDQISECPFCGSAWAGSGHVQALGQHLRTCCPKNPALVLAEEAMVRTRVAERYLTIRDEQLDATRDLMATIWSMYQDAADWRDNLEEECTDAVTALGSAKQSFSLCFVCLFCGIEYPGVDALHDHGATCSSHPAVIRAEKLDKETDRLAHMCDHLQYLSAERNWEKDDLMATFWRMYRAADDRAEQNLDMACRTVYERDAQEARADQVEADLNIAREKLIQLEVHLENALLRTQPEAFCDAMEARADEADAAALRASAERDSAVAELDLTKHALSAALARAEKAEAIVEGYVAGEAVSTAVPKTWQDVLITRARCEGYREGWHDHLYGRVVSLTVIEDRLIALSALHRCETCRGTGEIRRFDRYYITVEECQACHGTGIAKEGG